MTSSLVPEWVHLAQILGSRGNRGEVTTEPLTSRWERLREDAEVVLVRPDGTATPARVQEVWMHKDRLIFKFEGVDSISDAELWKGAAVCVPPEKRPELPSGEYYLSDLVKCSVVNRVDGRVVGVVAGWQETGGPVLLEIESEGRLEPRLIPFVPAICVLVDLETKRIEIDPPEGLLEL